MFPPGPCFRVEQAHLAYLEYGRPNPRVGKAVACVHLGRIQGADITRVVGDRTLTINGATLASCGGDVSVVVAGGASTTVEGPTSNVFRDDVVARHSGHHVVIVGSADETRSTVMHTEGAVRLYGSAEVNAVSPKGLILTCGKSQIRISPDSIVLSSPKISIVSDDVEMTHKKMVVSATDSVSLGGQKLNLASSGASIALDSKVNVQGSQINLAGGSGASAEGHKKATVTTLVLVDQKGRPLGDQRVLLRKSGDDTTQRMVVLDAAGKVEIDDDDPFEVAFPDLAIEGAEAPEGSIEPHVVVQGDTVASIAGRRGVSPDKVWNDSANDALRKRRTDPAVLLPGDLVQLPRAKPVFKPVNLGAKNSFSARVPTMAMKLALSGGNSLAGTDYVVHGLGAPIPGTVGADGSVIVDVPITATSFIFELPARRCSHRVLVGHLDPAAEPSGVRQRLSNLGFSSSVHPVIEGFGMPSDFGTEFFVLLFQLASGLAPTGKADPDTIDALKKAHGT